MELKYIDSTHAVEGGTKRSIVLTDQPSMDICHAVGDHERDSVHMVSAVMPPATYGPGHSQSSAALMPCAGMPRETASDEPSTPKHKTRRSDSSPPMCRQYGPMARIGKRGIGSDTSQQSWDAWDANTQFALNIQRRMFEEYAEEYMTKSKKCLGLSRTNGDST